MRPFAPLITLVTSALLAAGLNVPDVGDATSDALVQRGAEDSSSTLVGRGGTASFTWYKSDTGSPSCQRWANSQNLPAYYVAASPSSGIPCGATVTITVAGKTINAVRIDTCPKCPKNGLDLNQPAFGALGKMGDGVLHGSFTYSGGGDDDNDDDGKGKGDKGGKGDSHDGGKGSSDQSHNGGKDSNDQWHNGGKGGHGDQDQGNGQLHKLNKKLRGIRFH